MIRFVAVLQPSVYIYIFLPQRVYVWSVCFDEDLKQMPSITCIYSNANENESDTQWANKGVHFSIVTTLSSGNSRSHNELGKADVGYMYVCTAHKTSGPSWKCQEFCAAISFTCPGEFNSSPGDQRHMNSLKQILCVFSNSMRRHWRRQHNLVLRIFWRINKFRMF